MKLYIGYKTIFFTTAGSITNILEKCKTLRGEPKLIMSCTHDSLKFLGAKWNLLNDSCMIDEVTAAACMHNIALYYDQWHQMIFIVQ